MKIYAVFATFLIAAYSANAQSYCNSTMSCSAGASCWTYTPCMMGMCVCNSGYLQDLTQSNTVACIWPTLNIGSNNCTKDAQCKGTYTSCKSNVCSCTYSNWVPNSANTECVAPPPQALNGTCDYQNSNCSAYAMCTTGLCQCTYGYKPSSDNVNCVPFQINDPCTPDNCVVNSDNYCLGATCSSGKYLCLPGLSWMTSLNMCSNATFTATSGQSCSTTNNVLCASSLFCGVCPENSGTSICLGVPAGPSGASTTSSPGGHNGAYKQEITAAAVVALSAFALMLRFA